jgi:EpsI family protein
MRRFAAVTLLLGATAAYGWLNPPVNLAVARGALRAVPQSFGPWRGTELSFGDAVAEDLSADDMLIRRYDDGPRSVWLCVVFHQNRRYGAHDPHTCYDSQGFVVSPEGHDVVDDGSGQLIPVNTFVAERKQVRRVVWYWWTTRGLATADVKTMRSRMALLGALDNRSWGAFVRVESVARDGDLAAATARVREFAGRVASDLPAAFAAASGDSAAARR